MKDYVEGLHMYLYIHLLYVYSIMDSIPSASSKNDHTVETTPLKQNESKTDL